MFSARRCVPLVRVYYNIILGILGVVTMIVAYQSFGRSLGGIPPFPSAAIKNIWSDWFSNGMTVR